MAPAYLDITDTSASQRLVVGTGASGWLVLQPTWTPSTVTDTCTYTHSNQWEPFDQSQEKETTKQKRDRVSKAKMHASWKLFNQKTPTVIQIKQICKPRHRLHSHHRC